MELIEKTSQYLSIPAEEVIKISLAAPHKYRTYMIPKKSGGYRTIHHPAKETKLLQYALIEIFLRDFPIHPTAMAYERGIISPIKTNAIMHKDFNYALKTDFKDFFPSLIYKDFELILNPAKFTKSELDFIRNVLFIYHKNQYRLAIGSPASPILSNILLRDFDEKITQMLKTFNAETIYTRYADDLTFSSNDKSTCKQILKELKSTIREIKSPNLRLNKDKTRLLTRAGKKMITGLIVTTDKKISIGRKKKKFIKKLIFDYRNQSLSLENFKYLKGYISYIRDVEPSFINSLIQKYGATDINSIIHTK